MTNDEILKALREMTERVRTLRKKIEHEEKTKANTTRTEALRAGCTQRETLWDE